MGLTEYRRKRDFKATPEPRVRGRRSSAPIFVVQLHHASHRHYDFRLEIDGVLKSWAIPKGPSFDPAVKRLAVEVEDHPLSYAGFEGDIPKGHYGAGHVEVFDEGIWEPESDPRLGLKQGELKFALHGDILRGSWVLVRTARSGRAQWLLIKHRDEYASQREADDFVTSRSDRPAKKSVREKTWSKRDRVAATRATAGLGATPAKAPKAARAPLQDGPFEPELCRSQDAPPAGDEWLHEMKWDGYRILATVSRGRVRLWSRNGLDWTAKAPEIVDALKSLRLKSAQLDGELIVINNGRAQFNALQARLSGESTKPLTYVLFDMPYLDGRSWRDMPLLQRKERLAQLLGGQAERALRFSEHQIGQGVAAFAQAQHAGMEGIVSKRADSVYRGARNGDWVKVKARTSDEFAVIGYTRPQGSRKGLGALLLGKPIAGGYRYVGRVGTGIDDTLLRRLATRLERSVAKQPPADTALLPRKDRGAAIWIKPRLVVEAFFQGVGGKGLLRQPAFKALREDKSVTDLRTDKSTPAKTRGAAVAADDAVKITHPERVVFPESGITKAQVAAYYRTVAPHLLRELSGRPLAVLRCPDGVGNVCFFQKHVGRGWGPHVHAAHVDGPSDAKAHLLVEDAAGILELVQMNVIEFHCWGALDQNIEHADRIVFDLDPHPLVKWPRIVAAARMLRKHLSSLDLQSFVRTSGGKGLHLVVPLRPAADWDRVRQFAKAVAEAMAGLHPREFVAVAGEKNRRDRIFIDWLRNGRGATSVASYSLRARAHGGVAMPVTWEELGRLRAADSFDLHKSLKRLAAGKADPWQSLYRLRQALPRFD